MTAYEIIMKKRLGNELKFDELKFMVNNFNEGKVPDYQMAAFLMAAFLIGLNSEETSRFTRAIQDTGSTLDLNDLGDLVVDKHSTGGVGDKTTIVLIPLLAACGLKMAKISGRGLGHTGGTIDKLESIRGYTPYLSNREFIEMIKQQGLSIISQTEELAPVEKKIYALRDVTATVDSTAFIASSIMSKKLAAGANFLALDVKVGRGAFMKSLKEARMLASEMVSIGKKFNKGMIAVISDMDQPLGNTVGNALEVKEAIETLKGNGPVDLTELCLYLGSHVLTKVNLVENPKEGKNLLISKIKQGDALKKFQDMISSFGGSHSICLIGESNKYTFLYAQTDGVISEIDAEAVGRASVLLGAGRTLKDEDIDRSVGFEFFKKRGEAVKKGECLVKIYYNEHSLLKHITTVKSDLEKSFKIVSPEEWAKYYREEFPLIYELIQ